MLDTVPVKRKHCRRINNYADYADVTYVRGLRDLAHRAYFENLDNNFL